MRIGVQDVAFVSTVQAGTALISAALMVYYDWRLFLVVVDHGAGRLDAGAAAARPAGPGVPRPAGELLARDRDAGRDRGRHPRDPELRAPAGQRRSASRRWSTITRATTWAPRRHGAIIQPLLEWNGQLFLSLVLVIGGYQALVGGVPLAALIQFLFLSNGLFAAIPNLGNQYNQALAAMAGAERVFALLDTRPDWEDAPDAVADRARRGRASSWTASASPTSPAGRCSATSR